MYCHVPHTLIGLKVQLSGAVGIRAPGPSVAGFWFIRDD